jgi:hypothetical protein
MIQLQQQFLEHTQDEASWRSDQDRRWKHLDENWAQLVDATTKSAECQRKNTEAIEKLVVSTSDMVETYRDFQGVTRVGKGVQNLMLFLLKWGVIGTGAVASIKWLIDYFSDNPIA